jgi:hypothetical protein
MTPEQAAELKAKYKRFVKIELDGKTLAFKPLDKAKIQDVKRSTTKSPELAVDLLINACKFVCVFGREDFDQLSADYPLAFAGGGDEALGVFDVLVRMAHGNVQIEEC